MLRPKGTLYCSALGAFPDLLPKAVRSVCRAAPAQLRCSVLATSSPGRKRLRTCLQAASSPAAGRTRRSSTDSRTHDLWRGLNAVSAGFLSSPSVGAAAEDLPLNRWPAPWESVDCWPMANDIL